VKAAIDASVLIFFAKMQKLGALLEIFPNLHMSQTVFNEIMEGKKHGFLESIEIEKGMRIAQLVIMPVVKAKVEEAEKLPITERYDKGFGSTGI